MQAWGRASLKLDPWYLFFLNNRGILAPGPEFPRHGAVMKAVVDINILLDVLLAREPHDKPAARFLSEVERGRIDGHICAYSVDTLHYLLTRASGSQQARSLTASILRLLPVIAVDERAIHSAFDLGWNDLEDAIIRESARLAGMEAIVTRDSDFQGPASDRPVCLTPAEGGAIALSDPEP